MQNSMKNKENTEHVCGYKRRPNATDKIIRENKTLCETGNKVFLYLASQICNTKKTWKKLLFLVYRWFFQK